MNYLLMICSDGVTTPEQEAVVPAGVGAWIDQTTASGVRKYGHPLEPAITAKTVRRRDGQTLVGDGPFAESKEFVAGFDLIEAADLDAALEIAAAHPVAQFHAIEVRAARELEADRDEFPLFHQCGQFARAEHLDKVRPGKQRYLMFMCVNGIAESDEEETQILRDLHSWLEDVYERDVQVFGTPLAHADTATTVRVRNGETLLTDGPFTEAKEFIAGLNIVDCENEQEAIELAAAHPLAVYHRVEVRAFTSHGG